MAPRQRHRSYCFTLNHPKFEEIVKLLQKVEAKYWCFGFETGKLGTEHLQGYIQFHNPTEFETVRHLTDMRGHVEVAKGTPLQNINYCSKDGEFYEFGERPNEGGSVRTKTKEDILAALADPMNNLSTVRHYAKTVDIAQQMEIKNREQDTKFYVHKTIEDSITEVLEYFEGITDFVVVEDLAELSFYGDPMNVIFIPSNSSYDRISFLTMNLWSRGKPILYKCGYEYKSIKPERFVIIMDNTGLLPLYKRI